MRSLYDLAYKMAVEGVEWSKNPPVLLSGEGDEAKLRAAEAAAAP